MHESTGQIYNLHITNNIFYTSNNETKLTEKGSYPISAWSVEIKYSAIVIIWSLIQAMVEVQWPLTLSQKYKW